MRILDILNDRCVNDNSNNEPEEYSEELEEQEPEQDLNEDETSTEDTTEDDSNSTGEEVLSLVGWLSKKVFNVCVVIMVVGFIIMGLVVLGEISKSERVSENVNGIGLFQME